MINSIQPVYTNWNILLLWKPRNLSSTHGSNTSLIDLIQNQKEHPWVDLPIDLHKRLEDYLSQWKRTDINWSEATSQLRNQWSYDQEFWLLNRLDTPTWWFLTFATNPEAKKEFLSQQRAWTIHKHYLTRVSWNPSYLIQHPTKGYDNLTILINVHEDTITVSVPLKHHRHLDDRMVAIKSDKDLSKWRDRLLDCTTTLRVLGWPMQKNWKQQSLVQCTITQWQRHQIRVHCQTLGYSIVGDALYGKEKVWWLELWCMGYQS